MRSLLVVLLLSVSTSGCASVGNAGAADRSQPLRAYLVPSLGQGSELGFHVSRPAHVAVFRISPGSGASLVFPGPGYGPSGQLFNGIYRIDANRVWNREQFVSFSSMGPQFYFMIASDQPLNVDQYGAYGYGLRPALGAQFTSLSGFNTMEALVSLTVPNPAAENWTTDYFIHWPGNFSPRPAEGLMPMTCGGDVFYVRPEAMMAAYQQLCVRDDVKEPKEAEKTPSEPGVVEVRPREPVPVADRIASAQLRNPEAWQQLREAADNNRDSELDRRARELDREGRRPTFDSVEGRNGAPSMSRSRSLDGRGAQEVGARSGRTSVAGSRSIRGPDSAVPTSGRAADSGGGSPSLAPAQPRERPSSDSGSASSGSSRELDPRGN